MQWAYVTLLSKVSSCRVIIQRSLDTSQFPGLNNECAALPLVLRATIIAQTLMNSHALGFSDTCERSMGIRSCLWLFVCIECIYVTVSYAYLKKVKILDNNKQVLQLY